MPFSDEDGALVPTGGHRKLLYALAASSLCFFLGLGIVGSIGMASARSGPWGQYQGDAAHLGFTDGPNVPLKPAWPKPFAITPGGPDPNYGVSAPVFAGDVVVTVGPTDVYEVSETTGVLVKSIPRSFGPSVPPAIAQVSGKNVILFTQGFGNGPKTAASATPSTFAGSPSSAATASSGSSQSGPGGSATPASAASAGSSTPELIAVNASDGKPLWKSPVVLGNVSRTGVTVQGSTAYVGDNGGTVYAVDVATGKLLWTHGLEGYLETPIAADGSVVVATTQFNVSARKGPTVVALDPSTGKASWTFQDNGAGASAPALDQGLAFVSFGEGRLLALKASDGLIVWDRGLRGSTSLFQVPVVGDGTLVTSDGRGRIYGFDEGTGRPRWVFATNEGLQRGSPVISGKDVLVGTDSGRIVAVDIGSGRMVFRTPAAGGGYRSMASSGQTLVVAKSGLHPGLVAFSNDPSGTLVSVPSPTVLDPAKMLGAFAEAAIPVALIVLMLGRPLLSRMGPVGFESEESEDEPADAWSDAEDPT